MSEHWGVFNNLPVISILTWRHETTGNIQESKERHKDYLQFSKGESAGE